MRTVPDQLVMPVLRRVTLKPGHARAWTLASILSVTAGSLLQAQVQVAGFELEWVMAAPFPSELTAAPRGGAVAWVFNDWGSRNLYMAEPPAYQLVELTGYRNDDGQEITSLRWTPDAAALVFVRGGDANGRGEYPNPTLEAEGVDQAVWIEPLHGEGRKIGEGNGPEVSPLGKRVAFIRRGQVWWAPTDSGDATQVMRTRGTAGSLRWSPDGRRLAFVSSRGDHAFIGVFDTADSTIRYLAPSTDRDQAPVWSPDSKQLAFIRLPTVSRRPVFGARREGEPWSIWVSDPATGQARRVWRAEPGTGSVFRAVVSNDQLQWGAGDRLVFPWERDGWTHLYSVAATGGAATLLTPGDFEVEHVTLTPDRHRVLFSSNQGDINRRHLWSVGVSAAGATAVTSGTGIEWQPSVSSDGRAIFFLRSDAKVPARPAVLVAGRSPRDLAPQQISPSFPDRSLVTPEAVTFQAADGMTIHGQLFRPLGLGPGERAPAVAFFHGGSRRQMLLGWHYMYYYHNAYALNQYLASRGYVVLSVNFRSGIGYGMKFREALDYGATGGSEYNDVQGTGIYLRSRPDVDPARLGLWGGSYGGYLTALGLARASDMWAAGVDLHGVHDWNLEWEAFVPGWDMDKDMEARRIAFRSSPMADVKTWRSPVLMIHGDDDRNVDFRNTTQLVEDLRKQGVEVEQLIFPDEVHDFLTHGHWLEAYQAAANFFDRHLSPPSSPARRASTGR